MNTTPPNTLKKCIVKLIDDHSYHGGEFSEELAQSILDLINQQKQPMGEDEVLEAMTDAWMHAKALAINVKSERGRVKFNMRYVYEAIQNQFRVPEDYVKREDYETILLERDFHLAMATPPVQQPMGTLTEDEAVEIMREAALCVKPCSVAYLPEMRAAYRALMERMAAQPSGVVGEEELAHLKESINEQLQQEKSGYWHSCTGCHESGDYGSEAGYPFSDLFKCHPGSGCSECGGIGVIWDNTDYDEYVKFVLAEEAQPSPVKQPVDAPKSAKCEDCGWGHGVGECDNVDKRFYLDHGMIHDAKTGLHVTTDSPMPGVCVPPGHTPYIEGTLELLQQLHKAAQAQHVKSDAGDDCKYGCKIKRAIKEYSESNDDDHRSQSLGEG